MSLTPSPAGAGQRDLDRKVVGGMAWTATVKWSSQVVVWGTTIVVARLLTPTDYGLVGMAAVFLELVTVFSEFGVGVAVVTFRDLERAKLSQLHTISVILGISGLLIAWGVAHPLGLFFHASRLPLVIRVAALGFPITAFRIVPYALLQKEMRFRLLAFFEGIQVIAQAVATLLLALFGFGYWALVIGLLVGRAASAFLPFVYEPMWFSRPRWRSLEAELRYSWHVISGRLCFYGYDNADVWIVGKILGQASLGAYSLAYSLARAPAEKLAAVTNRVALSLFSEVAMDLASVRRYLRNLTQGMALIIFPLGIGIVLVAPEFFHLALGKKWDSAIVPLQLLTLYTSFRAIRTLLSPLLNALGKPNLVRRNSLLMLLVLPPCFYIGSHWGIVGVAACWLIIYPLVTFLLLQDVLRKIEMRKREYARAIWPALSSCIPMVTAVLLLKWSLPHSLSLYVQLITEILGGAAAYCLTLLTLHRDRLRAFLQVRQLLAKTG